MYHKWEVLVAFHMLTPRVDLEDIEQMVEIYG